MSAGVYVHVPFCARKCPYCDFYSLAANGTAKETYVAAAQNQMRALPAPAADSLYFGGGTPSQLTPQQITRLARAAFDNYKIGADAEVSCELNPADCTAELLGALRAAGVNRLSLGVQSLDDGELAALGRRHDSAGALKALRLAFAAGFNNVSADVMLAIPGMTARSLSRTLARLAALPLTHISAYLLKIMPGTPYAQRWPDGPIDDDTAADLYEQCVGELAGYGFAQYEISNFARDGKRGRHNLKYWNCEDYIGIGPGAHSSIAGRRYSCERDLAQFCRLYSENVPDGGVELLHDEGAVDATDYIICRMRTTEGLSLEKLYKLYNYRFKEEKLTVMRELAEAEFLIFDGDVVRFTVRGFLVSNEILAQMI